MFATKKEFGVALVNRVVAELEEMAALTISDAELMEQFPDIQPLAMVIKSGKIRSTLSSVCAVLAKRFSELKDEDFGPLLVKLTCKDNVAAIRLLMCFISEDEVANLRKLLFDIAVDYMCSSMMHSAMTAHKNN